MLNPTGMNHTLPIKDTYFSRFFYHPMPKKCLVHMLLDDF